MATRPSTRGTLLRRPSSDEVRRIRPVQFIQEIISELRKVVWPTREEVLRLTYVVIIISALVGATLGLLDYALQQSFTRYLVLP